MPQVFRRSSCRSLLLPCLIAVAAVLALILELRTRARSGLTLVALAATLVACGGGGDGAPAQDSGVTLPATVSPLPVGVLVDTAQAPQTIQGVPSTPNTLLVRFRPGVSAEAVRRILAVEGGTVIGSVPMTSLVQTRFDGAWSDSRARDLTSRLERNAEVRGVYPDTVVALPNALPPADPWSSQSSSVAAWDGNFLTGANWHIEAMRVTEAWDLAYSVGRTVHAVAVGVIDNGFRLDHPDLPNLTLVGEQVVQVNVAGVDHGSHVSGIIGARGDNQIGVAGVAWRDASLYVVDALDVGFLVPLLQRLCMCTTRALFEQGLAALIDRGVKTVNMSFGSAYWDPLISAELPVGYIWLPTDAGERESLLRAQRKAMLDMLEALQVADKPVLLVQSAGNSSVDAANGKAFDAAFSGHAASALWVSSTPGDLAELRDRYPDLDKLRSQLLVVGATYPADQQVMAMAPYSSAGAVVAIWAPGGRVGCNQPTCGIFSTGYATDYVESAGTSMAAPMVTGLAALIWQTNPGLTAADVKRLILLQDKQGVLLRDFNVIPMDRGIVANARDSVAAALRIDNRAPVAQYSATRTGSELRLDAAASFDPEGAAIAGYTWVIADADGRTLIRRSGRDQGAWSTAVPERGSIRVSLSVEDDAGLRSASVVRTIAPLSGPDPQPAMVAPGLVSPANGATGISLTTMLTWSGGTATYWQVNLRNLATGTMAHTSPALPTSQRTYTVPTGALQAGVQFRWDVSACPTTTCSSGYATSPNATFTTAVATTTMEAPSLVSPTNGSTGVSLQATLSWSGGIATYWQVNVRNLATGAMAHTSPALPASQRTYGLPAGVLQAGVQFRWDVSACPTTACASGYATSANATFTTAVAALTMVAPSLVSPTNGATDIVLTPTLTWSGGTATYWQVNLRNLGTGAMAHTSSALPASQRTYSVPAGVLQAGVQFRWDVSACPTTACSSGYATSANATFTTAAAAPTMVAPSLVSPANGATGISLTATLTWSGGTATYCYDPRNFRVIAPAYLSANKAVCPTAI